MKILLCLNRDIYCLAAFNKLLPTLQDHQVKIYFSSGIRKVPQNKYLRGLQDIESDLSIQNIKSIAQESSINIDWNNFYDFDKIKNKYPVLEFQNINQDGLLYLSSWNPDLIISIRFGQIFKESIINIPKLKIINLHSGILPNYRGVMATFWAMLNDEKEIGTTLHFINDASIDTGDIIAISKNKIDYKQSFITNVFGLYENGVRNIQHFIERLEAGSKIETSKQNQLSGRYFSYPSDQDVNYFLGRNKFI